MELQKEILMTEIKKLKSEKMNDKVAYALAVYWGALQALKECDYKNEMEYETGGYMPETTQLEPVYTGGGAFHNAVKGKRPEDVYNVLEKHFEVIAIVAPKQYENVISALDNI